MTTPAWDLYLRTIVDIELSHDDKLRICPASCGDVGKWPDVFSAPMFILTAWNPGADPLPIEVNRELQRSLESELIVQNATTWRATGCDPESDYFEEGVAIHGLDEGAVIRAARLYDQDAIFVWTPSAWATVSCEDGSRVEVGWRIEVHRKE